MGLTIAKHYDFLYIHITERVASESEIYTPQGIDGVAWPVGI